MKAPAFLQSLQGSEGKSPIKRLLVTLVALAAVAGGGWGGYQLSAGGVSQSAHDTHDARDTHETQGAKSAREPASTHFDRYSMENTGPVAQLWRRVEAAYESVQAQVENLRRADEENQKLRLENSHLRIVLERALYENKLQKAELENRKNLARNKKLAGTDNGRTPSSVGYQPPEHLTSDQLFTLALTYFKAHEDEKAAKIMSVLLRSAEEDAASTAQKGNSYRTGRNYLLAAIAWYRVGNLNAATEYLGKTREIEKAAAVLDQVKLWEALIAEKQGKHAKAQEKMHLVLDRNPHSIESSWINFRGKAKGKAAPRALAKKPEAGRGIASKHP